MTCDEAKDLLNIEYEGNCCDLPQIQCNEANDQVLSVEEIFNDVNHLERRKGGGHSGGGHSSSHSSSHASTGGDGGDVGGSTSSSSGTNPVYFGGPYTNNHNLNRHGSSTSASVSIHSDQKYSVFYSIIVCVILAIFAKTNKKIIY
ncbi:hypothetical protein PIROE2DRAFT_17939 [Piromyces sp. E2]|nr:hypothetical protein PIROE2DRAFT_17939 [Piromyces sp. E2]|eukprot:OUM57150.1 hypothetical protein PIROE2DRAFT_17939 [Piromyces sp. E2]